MVEHGDRADLPTARERPHACRAVEGAGTEAKGIAYGDAADRRRVIHVLGDGQIRVIFLEQDGAQRKELGAAGRELGGESILSGKKESRRHGEAEGWRVARLDQAGAVASRARPQPDL